jgi:integrase
MSLSIFRRGGFWHYRGTIGPPERRARFRKSTGLADTKKNKAAAERYAAEVEARYWKGLLNGPASILTFEAAAAKYLAAGKSSRFVAPIRKYLGNKAVSDIKPSTIRQMAIDLYGKNSTISQNRQGITPAQAIINFAASCELCPPIRVPRFKEFKRVKGYVTLEWITGFRTTASDVLGAYALFMFLTGCRPSEGLAIMPDRDLDLPNRTVVINNGKVGHERTAHLPAMLVAVLANLETVPGRPLFWYRNYNDITWPWNKAIERAGIRRLTPHCCRHGAVTGLLRRGLDVVTVGKLVDMSPEMVLKTYGHAIDDATLTDRLLDTQLTRALEEVAESAMKTGTSVL